MTGLVTPTAPVPLAELGRVHFVGIGGVGMSGVAKIMLARGVQVSGSDAAASAALDELADLGAKVHIGHAAANLGDSDTLVISSAIRDDNPELAAARRRGLTVLHRSSALAAVMHGRRVIAVTGTHGKTTVTSMIATILLATGADPGYAIGGTLAATGTNAADGTNAPTGTSTADGGGPADRAGAFFVAEADESDGSFLNYAPDAAVVANIEADHLDNYGTPEAYRASFAQFIRCIAPGGPLIACADDPGAAELAAGARELGLRVRTYGESADADYRVSGISADGMETDFTVTVTEGPFGIKIGVPGRHNALNGAAAFAVVTEMGVDPGRAAAALGAYRGAARRMEPKGEAGGVRVLDTYAHHPTELAADLRAARGLVQNSGRVIAVFQPHLYSRTRIFAAEFGAALALADIPVVLDVYAAREDPEPGVSGRLVADAVPGGRGEYVPSAADAPGLVASLAAPGDVVLTMGAGDVTRLGPRILTELAGR
jgi:UDP-N-acetylmuramate--alanine ligase